PGYARLMRQSPALRDPNTGAWIVLDYDGVKRVLTDSASFSSAVSPRGTLTAEWLIFADAPRHARLRALIMRAFTPRSVALLEWRIRQIATGLLDTIGTRTELDLVAEFAVPLPLRVIT